MLCFELISDCYFLGHCIIKLCFYLFVDNYFNALTCLMSRWPCLMLMEILDILLTGHPIEGFELKKLLIVSSLTGG